MSEQALTDDALAGARRARSRRGVEAWRARLLATDGASFRVSSTSSDDIAAVLDDPSAPREARIGAALALANDPAGRPKIRVAAEATAAPALRIALEQVEAGTLDAASLEASLERAEATSARGSVHR